jgi:cation diffusion facilitator family transporter
VATSGSKKVIYAALIGNALIAIIKFIAASVTGSSAMLSEGIHSLVDTGNQVLLLYGLKRAQKPPDEAFPFGHGKEVYFWSFVVAILIFALGAGISAYEGVKHIIAPEPMKNVGVNYFVLGLAFVFEGAAWSIALKEFRRSKGSLGYIEAVQRGKDPSKFLVLFEDTAAGIGLVIAFFGILLAQLTGNPVFDGIASVLIGVVLGATAIWLAYETKGLLIGESANPEVVAQIREIAAQFESIQNVNEVLTMHMGPDSLLVNISVDFRDSLRAGAVEQTIAEMDRKIKKAYPVVRHLFVEAESRVQPPTRNAAGLDEPKS